MPTTEQNPEAANPRDLSIALIGPDESRRKTLAVEIAPCQAGTVREFSYYPIGFQVVMKLFEKDYDVVIVDLDSNPEYALDIVNSLRANPSITVMVYGAAANMDLVFRCMQAGAREFLNLPLAQGAVADALLRASANCALMQLSAKAPGLTQNPARASGKMFVFLGSKGGSGTTTLACNFAVALAKLSEQSTLLIDLDLPFGDTALDFGIVAPFSTVDALQEGDRLNLSFLSKLLTKHSSGVSLLSAPGKFAPFDASVRAIDMLLAVACQGFDNVVIDAGSRIDHVGVSLFKQAAKVYLVTQVGVPELRNSFRLISEFFPSNVTNLEVVLNRYTANSMGISEEEIAKAITKPISWKIPSDYATVRQMQTSATPLVLENSPISRKIEQMAREACGLPAVPEKKKARTFFG